MSEERLVDKVKYISQNVLRGKVMARRRGIAGRQERREKRKEKEEEGEEGMKTQRTWDAVLSKENPHVGDGVAVLEGSAHVLI